MIPLNLLLCIINAGIFILTGEWIAFAIATICAMTVLCAQTIEEEESE